MCRARDGRGGIRPAMVSSKRERLRVLAVDDCGSDVERSTRVLAEAGFAPEVYAVDRLAALAPALAERWDVVLTGMHLPDGTGLDVLTAVRAADDEVPVIVVDGTVGHERAVDVLRAGVDDFVLKSRLDDLGDVVRQRVHRAHARRLRRANADAQRRSEEELRAVIDLLPLGILIRHGENVAFANRALAAALGHAPAELLGRSIYSLVRPESRQAWRDRIEATESGGEAAMVELRFDRADGRIGTFEALGVRQLRFGGMPSVLVTLREVTDERQLRERLQMSDRMAAVGTLAAGVAHEINNPLACVTANLEVLREELSELPAQPPHPRRMPMAEVLAALNDAREGAERVRVIVRDLKLFSRGDAAERGPVDLAEVLQAAEHLTVNAVKGRARLVRQHEALPPVDGNATRLCQVFVNLFVNAAQAITPGHPEEHEIRVDAAVEDGRMVVHVRDTGSGVPAPLRARIFEPFFTTKGVGGGQGLGLSVCHGIVSALGGEIAIADGDGGRGTVVRVTLPLWPERPA